MRYTLPPRLRLHHRLHPDIQDAGGRTLVQAQSLPLSFDHRQGPMRGEERNSPRIIRLLHAQCRLARWNFDNFQKHACQLAPRFNVLQKRLPSSLGDGGAFFGRNG